MSSEPEMANVVILKTAADREREEDDAFDQAIRDEALDMLERAATLIRERGVHGIAISVVFGDDYYGRLVPKMCTNVAALIGAVATTQHDLTLRTLTDEAHEEI